MENEPVAPEHTTRKERKESAPAEKEKGLETAHSRGRESEPSPVMDSPTARDLQQNYTDHLKSLEMASMSMLEGVIKSARQGFHISLALNVSTFILGLVIIIVGLIMLFQSPEAFGRIIGIVSSLVGLVLVISLLFWKGPLERILGSVSNLAQINAISLGLAHRLNQIARVFVQKSLSEEIDIKILAQLNEMVDKAVSESVKEFRDILPKETAEKQAQALLSKSSIFSKKR